MKVRNVLIFPAATEIGLEINEALRQCKEVQLFGAGVAESSHGSFAFERFYTLRSVQDSGWLSELTALCRQLDIHYIFPAHDDVVVALSRERQRIPSVVLTVELEACIVTRSKRATYDVLRDVIRVPNIFSTEPTTPDYPVFVKPDRGQGSRGAELVTSAATLTIATSKLVDPLVCEYLPGTEYTVDCFSDRDHGLLFAGARVRQRMRNGISVNTVSVELIEAGIIAKKILSVLHLYGAWFFQLKCAADGELVLLEIAPRVAGSMSANRVKGLNFPLLTIFEHERRPIRMLINSDAIELDRALRNRFKHQISYSTLYIDLDDTLILRGEVNIDAVQLLFCCHNQGIKVKLITRHSGDLGKTLAHFRLAGLFDDVIHLAATELKSDYIRERDAIFVDDSFAERWDVSQRCGLHTFDCSMIELLLHSFPSVAAKTNDYE